MATDPTDKHAIDGARPQSRWSGHRQQMARIAVARPRLPTAAQLAPWLQRIDNNRIYANHGPLARELETALADRFGVDSDQVVATSSGTAGLIAALMIEADPRHNLVIMPAWTFVATAHAVRAAGFSPYLVDVEPTNGRLTPEIAAAAVKQLGGEVAAIMPVSPFGAPMDGGPWARLSAATGVPVIIDHAAGFDTARDADVTRVISLHATKLLGAGEGGMVLFPNRERQPLYRGIVNFGFQGSRNAMMPAFNGKMSEYHAAVGLASLQQIGSLCARLAAIAAAYHHGLPENVQLLDGFGESWLSSSMIVRLPVAASRVTTALELDGIETRAWWGAGIHRHTAFRRLPRGPLPVTERLARSTLGLPFHADLEPVHVERICQAVHAAVDKPRPPRR